MEEKKTEELTDETLDSVSGGARTIIANTNTPARHPGPGRGGKPGPAEAPHVVLRDRHI